jgi:hypothetical protein
MILLNDRWDGELKRISLSQRLDRTKIDPLRVRASGKNDRKEEIRGFVSRKKPILKTSSTP